MIFEYNNKQTKFLLAVIYRSPRRNSKISKTFKKTKIIKYILMIVLELTELFKTMNRPDPTRPGTTRLWQSSTLISRKLFKIRTWNFDRILLQVFNLGYQNFKSISPIVWKLCAFRQRNHFVNFQQFFYHNFRLK